MKFRFLLCLMSSVLEAPFAVKGITTLVSNLNPNTNYIHTRRDCRTKLPFATSLLCWFHHLHNLKRSFELLGVGGVHGNVLSTVLHFGHVSCHRQQPILPSVVPPRPTAGSNAGHGVDKADVLVLRFPDVSLTSILCLLLDFFWTALPRLCFMNKKNRY
jgi:hypothetical protein